MTLGNADINVSLMIAFIILMAIGYTDHIVSVAGIAGYLVFFAASYFLIHRNS